MQTPIASTGVRVFAACALAFVAPALIATAWTAGLAAAETGKGGANVAAIALQQSELPAQR